MGIGGLRSVHRLAVAAVSGFLALGAIADPPSASTELTRLLHEFLAGASRNDPGVHEVFWADDLVYTSSSGRRFGKAELMADVRATPPAAPDDANTTYSAEDVRIQEYGDTAVVAFRLVGTTLEGGRSRAARYLNTGTFRRRAGRWQAVSWQATRAPRSEDEARQELRDAQAALQDALRSKQTATLPTLLDESFVWTNSRGRRLTRPELLERLARGPVEDAPVETESLAVSVYGEAAVLRGAHTWVFVNRGEGWKAVALQ